LPIDADQDASSAQDATDAAPAKQAPAATKTDSTVNAAPISSDQAAKTQAPNASSSQQAADENIVSAQTAGSAQANLDQAPAPGAQPSAISSSDTAASPANAQGGTSAAKTDVNGLPNFGFAPSSATTTSTQPAGTTPSTAPAAAVPIAGLAVAIAARAQAGSNQFEIRLSPPELGRIDVQLNVDGNGQVTSHMTVERPDTLQLLQSQQPQLQSALEQAGLTTSDNGLQFTLRDQSFAGQNNGSGSQPMTAQLVIPEPDLPPIAATQIYTRAGLGTGIDIRV
jgi:flagellar hook-length control protein FliK